MDAEAEKRMINRVGGKLYAMKKIYLIFILSFLFGQAYAQESNFINKQFPSNNPAITVNGLWQRYASLDMVSGRVVQYYGFSMKNKTSKNLRVTIEITANLTCGNSKSFQSKNIMLPPYGEYEEADVISGGDRVFKEDCEGVKNSEGNVNRIRSLACRINSIKEEEDNEADAGMSESADNAPEQPAPAPNSSWNIQAPDNDRSVQAEGMRQLQNTQNYIDRSNEASRQASEAMAEDIVEVASAFSHIERKDSWDIDDVNSFNFGLSIGYHRPLRTDDAFCTQGFDARLLAPIWGRRLVATLEASCQLNDKLSPDYYATLFDIPAENFIKIGKMTSWGLSLHFGPHFDNSGGMVFAIQALAGVKTIGISEFQISGNYGDEVVFKEIRGTVPLVITYGLGAKLFLGDVYFSLICELTPPKRLTPVKMINYAEYEQPAKEINLSNLSLTIGYRLF